ncbi:hypothetical protein [Catenovulum adriaticum]|uniref:Uncharacterized protein n=1 Tax=Catenovulum adriaticum TaxID=2984846 RepID=A0ABY7AIS1_9ALTE|nr:hypothetical protein [Catenovulum sp. TS8]WAJ69339.1 hypothetical protein OLW01_09085 [Catenovulum sp. TS8]
MTQLLNRYQQAVLAELNIPIFLHHQSNSDLFETCDDSAVKTANESDAQISSKQISPENTSTNKSAAEISISVNNASAAELEQKHSERHFSQTNDEISGQANSPQPTIPAKPQPNSVNEPVLQQPQIEQNHPAASQPISQPQKNDNIDVIADKLTHASLQGQSAEQNTEQLERDKAIADKTKAINQLASILPTTSTASEVTENNSKKSEQFALRLSAIDASDLSILQVWSHNNDWTFEQDSQHKVIAYHPKLSQHMDFDLSQPTNKKSCWQLILSCLN